MNIKAPPRSVYALILVLLLLLFCLRVGGQALVAFAHVSFLPEMEEWFSGALAYPYLLASQIAIIALYSKVCIDLCQGSGYFAVPNRRLATGLLYFGSLYLGVMLLRYALRMTLYPHERWIGGSIPIFFHWVLAGFILVLGAYHWSYSSKKNQSTQKRSLLRRLLKSAALAVIGLGILTWIAYQVVPTYLSYRFGFPPPQYAVRADKGVSIVTADGVKLNADIFRPQHVRQATTVLVRVPMTKTTKNTLTEDIIARIWAEHGYAVVIAGTRGRFGSGGEFYPLKTERADGIDTLRWLANQPWYNGKIVTWGGSASGYTQWAIADQANPGPSALTIYLASTDFYRMFYPGGVFSLSSALSWALLSHGKEDKADWPDINEIRKAATGFPVIDADKRGAGKPIPFFRDWVEHSSRDSYWEAIDGQARNTTLKAPALLLCGWYDAFLPTELNDYVQIRKSAAKDIASKSRLIVGPWTHANQVIFPNGKESENFRLKSFAISLPWFDENLNSKEAKPHESPVEIFVMGANKWRAEKEWPLARAQYIPFYLCSNGRLEPSTTAYEVQTKSTDKYIYDPRNPVPTIGGAMIGKGSGIAKQNDIESRSDVLIFSTPPLAKDVEVTGPISLTLYVSSSAVNTDFTGKLVDVYPNGDAYNVSDGIIRHQFRSRVSDEQPVEQVDIEIWPTSNVFFKGHRIRLEVSSSNFPRYDANPNTGTNIAQETQPVKAEQTIFHDLHHPSKLILPIVE